MRRAVTSGGRALLSILILMFGASFAARADQTAPMVDLVLVLAIDCSFSVGDAEFVLQREGIAAAIESPEVISAISGGSLGRIAVSVVQWAGFGEQIVTIDWTMVSDGADASRLAQRISRMKRHFRGEHATGATDIGGLIGFSSQLALASAFSSPRHVIDISGDGKNNVNREPDWNRDAAVGLGLVINGLAIVQGATDLAAYYRQHVIGGLNSFVEVAQGFEDFHRAIRRKLLREIPTAYTS
jgi:hypothetical protein